MSNLPVMERRRDGEEQSAEQIEGGPEQDESDKHLSGADKTGPCPASGEPDTQLLEAIGAEEPVFMLAHAFAAEIAPAFGTAGHSLPSGMVEAALIPKGHGVVMPSEARREAGRAATVRLQRKTAARPRPPSPKEQMASKP